MIKFRCESCGSKLSVPQIHAGKKGKCPKCKNIIVVPRFESTSSIPERSDSGDSKVDSKYSAYDLAFLDVREKDKVKDDGVIQSNGSEQDVEGGQKSAEQETAVQNKLPWFIDIFLYPLNVAGIIHLICLWLLVFLLCPLAVELLGLGMEYIPVVYALPIAYVLYYLVECIRSSAAGDYRAPDFWMHPSESSKWDCISQSLVVLGCIAVCFWPVVIYRAVTGRTDLVYWLLLACGYFFFPMTLLAVVLFDSYNALNPVLLIGSIFRVFIPYCGMVLFFYGGTLLFIKTAPHFYLIRRLPPVSLILKALQFYLIFIAVGLLGRFYWRYKDKLNWEV